MGQISFALLREGSSDNGLVEHIRTLILKAGADAALGTHREYSGTVLEKLEQTLAEDPPVDLVFVHRDSDSRDSTPRFAEIETAAGSVGTPERVIPIVPIQEMEAWLLVDEAQIRSVVGRPNGTVSLGLPALRRIETTARPKEILRAACLAASEASGNRRRRISRSFEAHRKTLLERIDPLGPVSTLPSWQRFVADTTRGTQAVLEFKRA